MGNGALLLGDMPFLAVDCQSTGSTPAHGSLLEIGWAQTQSPTVVAHVVALPEDEQLTPIVARLTGLTTGDLSGAISPSEAWRALVDACATTPAPAVIHFAQFEERFLRELHATCAPQDPFPLDIVCTHAIATRLLPRLPRRGLRALAGYFGMTVEPARRCADHVAATVFVWRHLVELLGKIGVKTPEDLRSWMGRVPQVRARRKKKRYPMPRAVRLHIAEGPGVYRMLRSNGDVLYVGKARSLRRRVNSYFQKQSRVGDRVLEMLTQAWNVSVVETATALEAALLEGDEIKRLAPPYNVALVDRPGRQAMVGALRDVEIVEQMRAIERLLQERVGVTDGWAMRLGARLWRDRDQDQVQDQDQEELTSLLSEIVLRGARAVRLARWMCRLAESSVAWTIGGRSRMIVMERGEIVRRDDSAVAVVPPGYRRPTAQRWRCFDLATYDRVRVLSTELRRLRDEADDVSVRFGPWKALDRHRLARALSWV